MANLTNLMATIESVAAGECLQDDDDQNTQVMTAEMLEGTILQLADGQSIKVVQMNGSLDDGINVVQVETIDDVSTVEGMCAIDIDTEEQRHILSETGAHVVVKTENEIAPSTSVSVTDNDNQSQQKEKSSVVLPTVPFSFPGQTFDVKCQKLILNVWDFFRRVKKNPDLLDEIRTPQERAAAALHISAATIGKIGKNFKRTGKLETPGKRRKRAKPIVDSVDSEQELIIRSIVKEFKENRITPTLPLLLNECRERINFQGGATSFRRILQRMGYKGMASKMGANSNPSSRLKAMASSLSSSSCSSHSKAVQAAAQDPQRTKRAHTFASFPKKSVSTNPKKNATKTEFSSVVASMAFPFQNTSNPSSKVMNNLFEGNIFQLGSSPSKGETLCLTQEAASALALASARGSESQPQTIHLLKSDNTIQQIQIVYANIAD